MSTDLTKKTGVTVLPATIPLPTSDRPLMQLSPDSRHRMSAKEMSKQIQFTPAGEETPKAFRFVGPGFYYGEKATYLIIPDLDPDDRSAPGTWKQRWPEDQLFWIYIWDRSGREVAAMFSTISSSPTRTI
jgi:hypothetical protein